MEHVRRVVSVLAARFRGEPSLTDQELRAEVEAAEREIAGACPRERQGLVPHVMRPVSALAADHYYCIGCGFEVKE